MPSSFSFSLRRTVSLLLAGLPVLAAAPSAIAAPAVSRPVLVELFTSQGCSSCPPADAVLRDLSTQADVLPLAFHVDYWDYLGWADPFASPAFTARQQTYARHRGFNMYTPQAVVEGSNAIVGSNRGGVSASIASARSAVKAVDSDISRVASDVVINVGKLDPAAGAASGTVYLVSFDERQTTDIKRGENAGRSIVYANVVRSMRAVGEWHNAVLKINEKLRANERGERLALIVQDEGGEVWAVASTPVATKTSSLY